MLSVTAILLLNGCDAPTSLHNIVFMNSNVCAAAFPRNVDNLAASCICCLTMNLS